MDKDKKAHRPHILLLPYPTQGHINPILQFSKRLVSKGLKATLAITLFTSKSMKAESSSVSVETFSDGFDEGGSEQADSIEAYLSRLKDVGSQTLAELIKKQACSGYPVNCLVYDSFLPWAMDVAKDFGLVAASFLTQSCAVDEIYYYVQQGLLSVPPSEPTVSIPGLPTLELQDLPSFVCVPESYPAYLKLLVDQFSNIEKADWVFVNTFHELEDEVLDQMLKRWRLRTIGPTIPSMYLDKRVKEDKHYNLNLFKPDTSACMNWLNNRETGTVVYVSFGSLASLGMEQMEELAWGLRRSNTYFLWVVRASELQKLPTNFVEEQVSDKGLVVTWCPQLDVLTHKAVGCFVTHCGWNSTVEALSLGVPMVGIPQWTDQTTNAKYVQDVWGVGVRAVVDEKGIVRKEEVERCIREVMESERAKVIKKNNAIKWKNLAKEAVDEGGSSDKNIYEFIAQLVSST